MTSLQGEVFEALRAINIPEDKALKASEALSRRDDDIIDLRRDMAVMRVMVGGIYVVLLPGVYLLVRIAFMIHALG